MPELASAPQFSPVEPVTEVLHGLRVTAPYRWFEDQDSLRTRSWIEEQRSCARPPRSFPREGEIFTMSFLVLKAYWKLIYFDLYLARGKFSALYEKIRNYPVGKRAPGPGAIERICSAVDMACIWYWKEALCLQRSAATACLLKEYGVPAQMVIGAQQMPFKAHAWVEVAGRVVNDKPYTPEIYAVLDRC